ncbi:MAG TPA: hypothetical protein VKV74_12080 [Bryobacteraceae bacterium]|nr:hypothetical protein [Bryobacteraceae bacterium]
MKKLIFTSMLAAVGMLAQSSTPASAPQKQNSAAPAAQTPAKTHKHKKTAKPGVASTNAAPASSSTPAAPAKK